MYVYVCMGIYAYNCVDVSSQISGHRDKASWNTISHCDFVGQRDYRIMLHNGIRLELDKEWIH